MQMQDIKSFSNDYGSPAQAFSSTRRDKELTVIQRPTIKAGMLRTALLISATLATSACVTEYKPTLQFSSVNEYVSEKLGGKQFNFARGRLESTHSMRVSTYAQPPFIHAQQLETLSIRARDLEAICQREGGAWQYVGSVKRASDSPQVKHDDRATRQAAESILTRPSTGLASMELDVQQLERALQLDMQNQIVRSIQAAERIRPDRLTAEALYEAEKARWLGAFKCQKSDRPWSAVIVPTAWKAARNGALEMREITLEMAFSGI